MNARSSHVMNDDILLDIFKRLDLKDLFALQRVSQQFSRCSQQVLKKKTEVSVGFNELETNSIVTCFKISFEIKDWNRIDITPAISLKAIDLSMDYNRYDRHKSIIRQFRGVKKLYLSKTVISFKTLELIVNQWPQLEELYIYDIDFSDSSKKTITEWTQLLAKVKHIVIARIRAKYVSFVRDIIAHLPSLQSLNVWGLKAKLSDHTITLSVLTHCLLANIQSLYIGVISDESEALDVITSKCSQINKLSIYDSSIYDPNAVAFDHWRQWFALICDRLKALTYLTITVINISPKELAENISKLIYLQTLRIRSGLNQHFREVCFDTQEMARYMQPMVSLRSLSLHGLKCSPNRWSNFTEIFPNVRKLTLNFMYYRTDCMEGEECIDCFYRCMNWVSKLPKLKHMNIYNTFYGQITRHILELFADMDRLSIDSGSREELVEELIHFMIFTLDNRRRVFRLNLVPNIREELIQRMATIDIPVNGYVIVGHVFSLIDRFI